MKRISMWSGPRNISTAMMYFFHHRGDCCVIDEPFYGHYLKVTGLDHPGREEVMKVHEQDAEIVTKELLTKDYTAPIIFMKNMPHHMVGLDLDFARVFLNFFLIREPREMIMSYIKKIPEPQMSDLGLDLQYELFRSLCEKGVTPPVVDSFQLLSEPIAVLADLCQRLEISFEERMLKWPAGAIAQDGAWAKYWYSTVHASEGFGLAAKKEISDFPARLEGLAQECDYYYQELKKHTLRL